MKRRSNAYAGREMAEWSTEQLQRVLEMTPGALEPLGFARWWKDPAEFVGFSPPTLVRMQAEARALLNGRQ